MAAVLGQNSYGKSDIRLMKVVRDGAVHRLHDLVVDVTLEGDFGAAHLDGDNAKVLPTDTMKNTVYAKASELRLGTNEEFARELAAHFLQTSGAAHAARVSIAEHAWSRLEANGVPHDHAFQRGGAEVRRAEVRRTRAGDETVEAGIERLTVLKSARSGFSGYPRDQYTTLPETDDRIMATSISTRWRYATDTKGFDDQFTGVRRALLETFADHDSRSVQHTLYAMGAAVIERCPRVDEISITMPNSHHLLVDLAPLGLDNPNEIFVPTPAPYGLIEAKIFRT